MISERIPLTTAARVNHPIANATNNNQVSNPLMEKVIELTTVARRSLVETFGQRGANIIEHSPETAHPRTPNTTFQPPLISTPHVTQAQRLRIAQTEWNKILSTRSEHQMSQPSTRGSETTLAENRKDNLPWGDLLGMKGDNVTRVYSLNTNGLSIDRRGGRFDDLCKVAKEVQADVVCCQEHNLDTTRSNVRSVLYDTARQHWNRSRIVMGTTPIPFSTNYKPGGTMNIAIGDMTGRIITQTHDHWGRWTSQTFRGSGNTNVTVISAYQVVSDNPHTGLTTATAQQQSLLIQSQDSITPRKAFKRDLRSLLQTCITQGNDILLVGDFNEVFGAECDGISKLAAEFHLINLMQVRHHHTSPATYARGKKCLDYGLATRRVANALIQCGYEAFSERFSTDHRAYFFDLDNDILFGNMTQQLASPARRILKSNNVEQVTAYIKFKFEFLQSRNAFRRAEQLNLPGNRHTFAERLDSDVLKASLDAEQKIKPFREPAWSEALSKARRKKVILKKWLTMHRTGLDHSDIITKDMTSFGLTMELPTSKQQCNSMMRETQSEIEKIVAQSYQQRDQERDLRIQELDKSIKTADKTHARLLRRLKRNERVKRVCEKIKVARTKGQHNGVTRLEIPCPPSADPKSCTEWQTVDIPSEIVEHLQRRNRQHFGQAHGSPFTINPLATDLGFSGNTLQAEAILRGQYEIAPSISDSVHLLIQHLQMTHEIASMDTYPTVSLEEFKGKLKAWRESTTTSPSGMHLGHYKALLGKHKYSHVSPLATGTNRDDPHAQEHIRQLNLKSEYDQMQQSLVELHLSLMNYALERGYSFHRWQCIANTILFKDPGNVKIHRTRVIHIYEADFNLMLGIKWRVALYQSEALKQLNEGQFGSRPRRNAVDPVMIEELQLEISRLTRRMFLQTNYDATACYDRIIPNLAMLASRRFGVAKEVTESNVSTLQKAKYHVRTELGLSDSHYSHSLEWPIYGTGQGSGNSPMIWCFLSSLLFDCYDLRSHPADYCNPDWSNKTRVSMIGFVDDSNGQVNSFFNDDSSVTLNALIQKARSNVTTWSDLLQATGGALELSKCSYHVAFWKFSIQGAPVLSNISHEITPLQILDSHTGNAQTLEYLPPSVAHKTLGHYKEPMGLQKMQFRQLKAKSDDITAFLWSNHFTREEAWTFYRSCYIPAVTYPLASSFLTQSQLKHIQCKAMAIITAKCGFNRNTKTEVLYGPKELGGADFRHLIVQQGIAQTMYFLRHWRSQSSTGKLLKCTMAWAQLTAGTSYPILERVTDPLPHLEAKWIGSLRNFLATISASIQLDDPCIPAPQREHDHYLMDMIAQSARFTPAEIRKLNYCRLYLQAVTLSDITKPNGWDLDPCLLQGRPSLYSSCTRWHTVNQDRPSEQEWKLWKLANGLWGDHTGRLFQGLGAWTQPLSKRRFQSFAYTHRRSLYVLNANREYSVYRHLGNSRYRQSSSLITRTYDQIPERARSAEVINDFNGIWKLRDIPSPTLQPPYIPPSAAATFELFVTTLDPWEADLLSHVTLSVDPFSLCLELVPGFRAVSDGSVRVQQHGSFGWVLSTLSGERLAVGMGPARGRLPKSYRAEAYGLLSLLRFLLRVKEFTYMHDPWRGIVATDSQGVLDTLQEGDHDLQEQDVPVDLDQGKVVLDCLRPDWDILIEIQTTLKSMPRVKLQYVKGHQDKMTPYRALDLMGQLNVDADTQAGNYNDEFGAYRGSVIMSPLSRAHLNLSDGTVTSKYSEVMRYEATTKPLLEYIQRKNGWDTLTIQSIHWDAHALAIKNTTIPHTHLVKLLHKMLPTHALANKFDGGTRTCPLCGSSHEDFAHIIRCQHPSRAQWRNTFLTDLRDLHLQTDTSPRLSAVMLDGIRQWFRSPPM